MARFVEMINFPHLYAEPPQLVITPNSTFEVDVGATVTYVCVGFSRDDPPSIFWRFGDELLSNETSSLVTVYESQVEGNNLVFTESILELCSVELENDGMYSCTANNSRGSNRSNFTLSVRPPGKKDCMPFDNIAQCFLTNGETFHCFSSNEQVPFHVCILYLYYYIVLQRDSPFHHFMIFFSPFSSSIHCDSSQHH